MRLCLVKVRREGGDAALGDLRVLVLVLTDAVEVLDVAGATQQLHEILVVGDDQELEVPLSRATLDDSGRVLGSGAIRSKKCERAPRVWTHSTSACARDSILSLSRLVVGSSRARIPQLRQKVSASARRMIREANTCAHPRFRNRLWHRTRRPRNHRLVPSDQRCSAPSCPEPCRPSP